ncbi:lytic murein transglycosylase [Pseudorhodoplanes sinuspersici]|uniref:Lytic transglycosylase n=1 Tax=Pseudorhodoplanes sinuspersici TaxID=1235591 RepID=A0A1W6ZX13_9HYPH|nr:lytic transglycosylase [Pseudorhodoplanes sinuspersici]RKE73711.1 lytic murein transglycosylase [Pseudorhodoplanes sinuspersici]
MIDAFDSPLTRRRILETAILSAAAAGLPASSFAQTSSQRFEQWVVDFRPRALARGISGATYDSVMNGLKPDMGVFALQSAQPEFKEQLWQYLNRRVSEWRIVTGRERAREYAPLFNKLEQDFGVSRGILLGLWGMETAYGDPVVHQNHMRPVFPCLAALAWGEPRRRKYWETELINALKIVERGWSNPREMRGSWAGAMGHTQWMPEVWLNIGADYDGDGRANPFGKPNDALAGTCRYLLQRGGYQRGEPWGCEVRGQPSGSSRTYAAWQKAGVVRADGKPYTLPHAKAKGWVPVPGGPSFLIGANFNAVKSYNPSMNYALAICHLGDRVTGGEPFVQSFPGSERAPTLAEVQEIQKRLTALGFDTAGTDGRVGLETMRAVRNFQRKAQMEPADGYAGVKLLARLRQAS